jgi:ATP-binding cassette subfamily B protein
MIRFLAARLGITRWFLAGAFALALLSCALSLVYPMIGKFVIDEILVGGRKEYFWTLSIAGFLMVTVGSLLRIVPHYYLTKQEGAARIALSTEVHRTLLGLPLHFFETQGLGELLSCLQQDLAALFNLFSRAQIYSDVKKVLLASLGGCAMFYLEAAMGAACTGCVLLSSALARIPLPLHRRLREEGIRLESLAGDQLTESVRRAADVKVSGREAFENRRYEDRLRENLKNSLRAFQGRFLLTDKGTGIARYALTSSVGIYGAWRVLEGQWSLGAMTAFFIYYGYFNSGMTQLALRWINIQKARASLGRLGTLLRREGASEEDRAEAGSADLKGDIRFERVTFSYPGKKRALDEVSFTLPEGKITALVGPNGAGKSTAAKLLARCYEPEGGALTIGGRDIRSFPLKAYRRSMGMVLQDGALFNRSIHENIAYGRERASEEEIRRAGRLAGVEAFVLPLGEGYGTKMGERGVRLSAGQRRCVAMAREILHDPHVLVLDEAFAALDGAREERVYRVLNEGSPGRTLLVITHRLETAARADWIIVLDEGRRLAEGRHEDLIESCAVYREVFGKDDPAKGKNSNYR